MKTSCPQCAYAYEVLPERCSFCARSLQGGRRLPFTGRVSLTEELLEQAKEVTRTQRAQVIALESPQHGGGVSTFLHHFGLHVTRLSLGFRVINAHPFSLNAEPSPLQIPLIYQHLLSSLFELNLSEPLTERLRWAQRRLSALTPPSHVERALRRLMTTAPKAHKALTSSPPTLNNTLLKHSKRPTQVMLFQELEADQRAPEEVDEAPFTSSPYQQPLSLAGDESYEESLMGSLTHQLLRGAPTAPQDLIQSSLDTTLHPSREEEPTAPPLAQQTVDPTQSAADDLTHLLSFYARRHPLTLCFLDLQSAPASDLKALHALLSRLKKLHLPLLILLERPPRELRGLWEMERELSALSFEEVSALVRDVFPTFEEPIAFVEVLLNRSKGHPLTLIYELLEVTMRGAEGLAHPLLAPVKPTRERYQLQDMLTLCVATGPTTSASQLTLIERCLSKSPWSARPQEEHDWRAMLQAAVERGDLKQTQHRRLLNEPSYRFARSELKEPYERLWSTRYTARVRQAVHCRLAEWMSAQEYAPEAHVQVGLSIAEQWLLGAQPLEAARVSLEVAQLLIKRGNHTLAYSALNQAYGVLEEREVPWGLLKPLALARAQVAAHRGLPHEAEPTLLYALKRASQLSDLNASYELGQQLSQLYLARGFHQKAREVSEWLSSLPREALYERVPGAGAVFDRHARAHSALAQASLPPLQPSHEPQPQSSLTPHPPQRHMNAVEGTTQRTSITMNDVRDLTPPPSPVLHVLSTLKAQGYEAWVVGGSVRDRLLGRPVNDWDITTSATPQEVSACFERVIETGVEHGTVTILSEGLHVEVTTYRVDGLYLDGRRPSEVSFTRSLREDLARRDFTINAIAWDPTTKSLEDPFEGLTDLGRGLIKAVGHPLDRFREDGLRVLRAVRFAAVLGFTIEPETWGGLCGALDVFQRVAMERVQVELFKALLSDDPAWALSALKQSQLLALICPKLDALDEPLFERLTRALTHAPAHLEVRLALLYLPLEDPEDVAHQHLTHLKSSRKLTQGVAQLLRWRQVDPSSERTDGQVRALSAQVSLERLPLWVAYRKAWAEAERDEPQLRAWGALEERFKALRVEACPQSPRDLALRGNELAALLNLPPSPLIGALLNALLQHVWTHPEDNTSARLLAVAPTLAQSLGVELPSRSAQGDHDEPLS